MVSGRYMARRRDLSIPAEVLQMFTEHAIVPPFRMFSEVGSAVKLVMLLTAMFCIVTTEYYHAAQLPYLMLSLMLRSNL